MDKPIYKRMETDHSRFFIHTQWNEMKRFPSIDSYLFGCSDFDREWMSGKHSLAMAKRIEMLSPERGEQGKTMRKDCFFE